MLKINNQFVSVKGNFMNRTYRLLSVVLMSIAAVAPVLPVEQDEARNIRIDLYLMLKQESIILH